MSQNQDLTALVDRLACPSCRGGLRRNASDLECLSCSERFEVRGEVPVLLNGESRAELGNARNVAENVKLRSRLRPFLGIIEVARAPHPFAFMRWLVSRRQRGEFSRLVDERGRSPDDVFLDVGSGILGGLNASGLSDHIRERVIPLEIAPTAGVGIVGDAHHLPWRDSSLSGLLIQGVLEHVRDPEAIAAEIFRVLRPGAPVYVEVPFIQHYHLDPLDYRRFTLYGLDFLFGKFEKIDSGVCAGPASGLTDVLTEFPALPFSSPLLYWTVKQIAGWIFSPIQLLDGLWYRTKRAHMSSAALYYLGRKPINRSGA
jgi:uncharacterized protein YbaR (Trm112 family)/SAM-dependent methyltransferase